MAITIKNSEPAFNCKRSNIWYYVCDNCGKMGRPICGKKHVVAEAAEHVCPEVTA